MRGEKKTPVVRLRLIQAIIDEVETRCLAGDGPVLNTRYEMTDAELRTIYRLSKFTLQPKRAPKGKRNAK